jgi:hypothetical protein
MSIAAGSPEPLLGRDAEVELLVSLLDGVQDGGSAGLAAGGAGLAWPPVAAGRSCCTASRESASPGCWPWRLRPRANAASRC